MEVDERVDRLARQLRETGRVDVPLRRGTYAFLIVSSALFTGFGLVGVALTVLSGFGWTDPPSAKDVVICWFLTLVPGSCCALFTWTWRRERHPVRVSAAGVVLSRVGLVAEIPWADVVGARPRLVGGVACLEVLVSSAWYERHRVEHSAWIRRRAGHRVERSSAIVGGGTVPPGHVLADWIDREVRLRAASGRPEL